MAFQNSQGVSEDLAKKSFNELEKIASNGSVKLYQSNKDFYENILCDGGLCFSKELTDGVLEMSSKSCKVFITRTFTLKLPIMKIADYFPQPTDFEIKPTKVILKEEYSFYIWQF